MIWKFRFQWRTPEKIFYLQLAFRWLISLILSLILMLALLDVGQTEEVHPNHFWKFFIYLTNWTLMSAVIQSWIGTGICTTAFITKNHNFGKFFLTVFVNVNCKFNRKIVSDSVGILENDQSKWKLLHRMSYSCALVFSFFITPGYWFFVYNPSKFSWFKCQNMIFKILLLYSYSHHTSKFECTRVPTDNNVPASDNVGRPNKIEGLHFPNSIWSRLFIVFTVLFPCWWNRQKTAT